MEIYQLTADRVFEKLRTLSKGLTEEEAQKRLKKYGPNEIEETGKTPLILKFLANFYHLMALMLWAAAVLAFASDQPQLGYAVIGVIVINALFSFGQEYKAEKAVEALKKLVPLKAKVIRDGQHQELVASQLVPGDLIMVEEGDKISADARLVSENELRTDNSTLTGESEPVRRTADAFLETLPLPQVPNLIFAGTNVAFGSGRAVVYATGMHTEFGKIARLTQQVLPELSPLQKQINRAVKIIAAIAVISGVVLFGISSLLTRLSANDSLVFAIGMIVANMPEGLLPTVTLALAVGVQRLTQRHSLVKKLSSVETLGSTTVICSDKTGTLTQNEMTVREVWTNFKTFRVTEVGYEPTGQFIDETGKPASEKVLKDLRPMMRTAIFCNNARLRPPGREEPRWRILGDPTEAALIVAAKKIGLDDEIL